jgi:hypothetical protein
MTFVMDTDAVKNMGATIEASANGDTGNASNLSKTVNQEIPLMPSILEYPLTQFATAITNARMALYKQRTEVGKALQDSASATELDELKKASTFNNHQGTLPLPPPTK